MSNKQQMREEIARLRERVAVLEAELTATRPVHQFVITTPAPTLPVYPPQWWQNPVTCGAGVNSILPTGN